LRTRGTSKAQANKKKKNNFDAHHSSCENRN
jgi:hypothetical protein